MAMQVDVGFQDWPRAISDRVLTVELTRDRTEVEIGVEYEEKSWSGSTARDATARVSLADWDQIVEHIRAERLIPPPVGTREEDDHA